MPPPRVTVSKELADWFNGLWQPGLGAVDGHDLVFIQHLIVGTGVNELVEIGCASGLSTAALAHMMAARGGGRIVSFDLAERFYADQSKPVGYLLEEGPDRAGVAVEVKTGVTALDVRDHVTAPLKLVLIDAMHKHPWPLLDTLSVLPLMAPGGVIIHHDLQMFRGADGFATGPKILLDQVPPRLRIRSKGHDGAAAGLKTRHLSDNIYALRVPKHIGPLADKLSAGFCLGWELPFDHWLPGSYVRRFETHLKAHFGERALENFQRGVRRYQPDRIRYRLRARASRIAEAFGFQSPGRRLARKIGR